MRSSNPYRPVGQRPPPSCFVRGLEPEAIDAQFSHRGEPLRPGDKNPWKGCLSRIRLGSHSLHHDKGSELAKALLEFGGAGMVNRGPDSDLPEILARGQLWPALDGVLMEGFRSRCHGNAAMLWAAHQEDMALATGYALSDDGLWRQHIWCVQAGSKVCVIETTERRLLYFGFAMTAEKALDFHECNVGTKARLAREPVREIEPASAPAP